MENKILYAVQLREDAISIGFEGEASQDVEMAFPRNFEKILIPLGKCERTKNYLMFAVNVNKLLDKAKYLYVDKGYETCLDDEIIVRLNVPDGGVRGDYSSKVFVLTTDSGKAQKYVQDSQMQMQYLLSRIQPAEKVDMNIIWDDDGKCALQISSEGAKNSFSLPDRISFASIMKGIRDSRGTSREEVFPFIRWDVVDMQRAFIEG